MSISPISFSGLLKINENVTDEWNKRTKYVNTANIESFNKKNNNTTVWWAGDKYRSDEFNIDCDTFAKAFVEAEANPDKIVEINERK